MIVNLRVNGVSHQLDIEEDMPLLWVLRDELGLKGTKFGCGVSSCGACTVHVDGEAMRTCTLPVGAVNGANITTIEGLGADQAHPVQIAWIEKQVPQCGYCQSGMIMAVAALLDENPNPTRADLDDTITNICRCGTYQRVRAAVDELSQA
jgi:isoquinoline 1-oxidoreductase alpha subunit